MRLQFWGSFGAVPVQFQTSWFIWNSWGLGWRVNAELHSSGISRAVSDSWPQYRFFWHSTPFYWLQLKIENVRNLERIPWKRFHLAMIDEINLGRLSAVNWADGQLKLMKRQLNKRANKQLAVATILLTFPAAPPGLIPWKHGEPEGGKLSFETKKRRDSTLSRSSRGHKAGVTVVGGGGGVGVRGGGGGGGLKRKWSNWRRKLDFAISISAFPF